MHTHRHATIQNPSNVTYLAGYTICQTIMENISKYFWVTSLTQMMEKLPINSDTHNTWSAARFLPINNVAAMMQTTTDEDWILLMTTENRIVVFSIGKYEEVRVLWTKMLSKHQVSLVWTKQSNTASLTSPKKVKEKRYQKSFQAQIQDRTFLSFSYKLIKQIRNFYIFIRHLGYVSHTTKCRSTLSRPLDVPVRPRPRSRLGTFVLIFQFFHSYMKKSSMSSLKKRSLDISLQHKNEASYKFSKKKLLHLAEKRAGGWKG